MAQPPRFETGIVWFRRDLRVDDHAALHHALAACRSVHCLFVFDRDILDALPERSDRRVAFIRESLRELQHELDRRGGALFVVHGRATEAVPRVAAALGADAVFVARDYEPAALRRDRAVAERLEQDGRELLGCKDQVVFDTDEVLTAARTPFSVFTPYKNAWMRRLEAMGADGGPGTPLAPLPVNDLAHRLAKPAPDVVSALVAAGAHDGRPEPVPTLEQIGFSAPEAQASVSPGASGGERLLDDFLGRIGRYHEARDFPAVRGPSYLSVHLRFGTLSVRRLAREALRVMRAEPDDAPGAATWLSELTWRDFYFQILFHHPRVVTQSFKPAYDAIRWESGPAADRLFEAWCEGRTGYPLVDAAMLQLNRTGYMHNRLRMITASFLCKDLGIDWRRGERYFADRLIDYDLSANNGGWQWAASTGCDAQPYFRIFNPVSQSERFDPHGRFIRRYLPRLERLADRQIHAPWKMPVDEQSRLGFVIGTEYPAPVVDHDQARRRTLERYSVVKAG
jgi:deoxyribodipyrimidine photo-lyase